MPDINIRDARIEDAGIITDFNTRLASESEEINLDPTVISDV